jgi:hypothetical protein
MHVTRLLSEDHSIAAGIPQCPCVDAFRASRMKHPLTSLQLGFWGICDLLGSLIGLSPVYVRLANTPDEAGVAIMDAPDVAEGWSRLHSDSVGASKPPLANRIAARSILTFPVSRPALSAHRRIAPYLIVVPSHDYSVAPVPAAEEGAGCAPRGE